MKMSPPTTIDDETQRKTGKIDIVAMVFSLFLLAAAAVAVPVWFFLFRTGNITEFEKAEAKLKKYEVAILPPHVHYNDKFALHLHVLSDSEGSLEISGHGITLNQTSFNIATGELVIDLPQDAVRHKSGYEIKSLSLRSDVDITVIGDMFQGISVDSFLALPNSALSTEYVIVSYEPSYWDGQSQFLILATENDTRVEIHLRMILHGSFDEDRGISVVYLERFQSYQYLFGRDMTGTVIKSNHDIAVYSGVSWAPMPYALNLEDEGFSSYFQEQMLPTRLWATQYIVPALNAHSISPNTKDAGITPYFVRIVGIKPNTKITLYTKIEEMGTILKTTGDLYEKRANEPLVITSSEPVSVVQFPSGEFIVYPSLIRKQLNPSMMVVAPLENHLSSYRCNCIHSPPCSVSITIATETARGLMLDGNLLDDRNVTRSSVPPPLDSYLILMIAIDKGVHRLTHKDMTVVFGATVYNDLRSAQFGHSCELVNSN